MNYVVIEGEISAEKDISLQQPRTITHPNRRFSLNRKQKQLPQIERTS
jgi:hypothetical protein